ncbi:MAG TPA: NADH-quinone oxidoreductase subunit C [bacterium]
MGGGAETRPLIAALRGRFPRHVLASHAYLGQDTVVIRREGLVEAAAHLKQDPALAFDFLMDLSCVDYKKFGRARRTAPTMATPSPLPYFMRAERLSETWERGVSDEEFRFDVVYHLYSSPHNHRLRLRVPVTESDPSVPTLCGLWDVANWFEREAWDMFGVTFSGHPDLRRLLMYDEFQGHPLRKDYPIRKRQPLIGPVN